MQCDDEIESDFEYEQELPGRPYCAKCGKRKGSKRRFYPERACSHCGSKKTVLRNQFGATIDWDKWTAIQNDKRYAELALEYD